ncbi:MAG: hypothetical protein LUC32_04975 [Clostridiales bacterium]|nr:hypothetical protein [Clostridiales bacterium]
MRFLNKLERKFGRFAIPGLMKYIIACYVIGYVIMYTMPNVLSYLTLEPYMIFHYGQVWRLISWVLIPPSQSNIIFVIIMLVLYYQLGTVLEQTWGTFRFNVYIFGGVIFTILGAMVLFLIYGVNTPISIGSSFSTYYINMTIFLAFAVCYPDMRVMLYFIIPVKMKWMAAVYGALIAYSFVVSSWSGRVAIIASVLNFLIFFVTTRHMASSPRDYRRRKNFKKQVHQPRTGTSGAIHKCAICGRTELDDPNLQFRYCSKCRGNFEYCQDHLFTHKHVE